MYVMFIEHIIISYCNIRKMSKRNSKEMKKGGSPGKGRQMSGVEAASFMRVIEEVTASSIFDEGSVEDVKNSGIREVLHEETYFEKVLAIVLDLKTRTSVVAKKGKTLHEFFKTPFRNFDNCPCFQTIT